MSEKLIGSGYEMVDWARSAPHSPAVRPTWAEDDMRGYAEMLESALMAAKYALRGYREHHDTYGSCRIEPTGDRRCKDCRRADRALDPVSDRQPEGEKP